MDERGIVVDRITLVEQLQNKNLLESIGGIAYIIELDNVLPQIFNLDSYVRIVLDKARLRDIIHVSQEIMDMAFGGDDTPNKVMTFAEEKLKGIGSVYGAEFGQTVQDYIESFESVGELLNFKKRMTGVSTGFATVDERFGGLPPGSVFTLAGRPGSGKSAMMLNMIRNMASPEKDEEVVVFSPEMSMDPIFSRFITRESGIPLTDLREIPPGQMRDAEREKLVMALSTIQGLGGIRIDETVGWMKKVG